MGSLKDLELKALVGRSLVSLKLPLKKPPLCLDTKRSWKVQVTPEIVLDSLSSYKVQSSHVSSMVHFNCDICQHRYRIGDYVTSLPCQHRFHSYCIQNWLRWVRTTCPVDKKPATRLKYNEEDNVFQPSRQIDFLSETTIEKEKK